MATPQLDVEMSEPERRKLVKGLAERGSATDRTAETGKAAIRDYSAAAAAAFEGGPVDLGEGAMATLQSTATEAEGQGQRYADAQAEIFKRGQGREGIAGNKYYDAKQTEAGAVNVSLIDYERRMREAEAARVARANSSSSSGSDFDWSKYTDGGENLGVIYAELPVDESLVNTPDVTNSDILHDDPWILSHETEAAAVDNMNLLMQGVYERNGPFVDALNMVKAELYSVYEFDQATVDRIMALVAQVWSPQFGERGTAGTPHRPGGGLLE